jgi:Domain of unknown function (DUF3597)
MSLFNNLMSKIFGHAGGNGSAGTSTSAPPTAGSQTTTPTSQPSSGGGGAAAPPAQPVDVAAILDGLAAKNPEKLDWKHSIVDLMKLVGMDSSLSARKQLATELHYTGDQNDSASMNIWLHKEVLKKLAANGGKVPPELLK